MRPKKLNIRLTDVSEIVELSPHLRRIVVAGDGLTDFPVGQEGSYVKVVLQQEGANEFIQSTAKPFRPS